MEDFLAVGELNGLAEGAGYWLNVPEMTAPIVADLLQVDLEKARTALDMAIGTAFLWSITAEEQKWLGPATPSDLAHGRIPLQALRATNGTGEGHAG